MFRFEVIKSVMMESRFAHWARVFILCSICISFLGRGYSQEISPQNTEKLKIMEDSLVVNADSMFKALIPDSRIGYSERFVRQLVRTLKIPGSAFYKFDSLNKFVNIIYADDNAFRMFNWEIEPSNITRRYYGAIQMPDERLKLYGLLDYSEEMGNGAEDSVLTGGKWFGALYYRIMSEEVQGQKVYTMFGFNGSAQLTSRKVLDALVFTERGVQFGAPIFGVASHNFPKQRVNRFILEYKKGVQASMNWDSTRNVIIFDKLVSLSNDPGRRYTYAPSGGYDGLRWQNGNWTYIQDLIPVQVMHDGEEPPQK